MKLFHHKLWVLCIYTLVLVDADIYMHNPRGSNNRLDEKSANRRTGNRLFDSQNNNRGGYNVGDKYDRASGNIEDKQYQMSYIMSPLDTSKGESVMPIEWTNQHGCGESTDTDPAKCNCNIVIQMMCQPNDLFSPGDKRRMRDGTSTSRQDYRNPSGRESEAQFVSRQRRIRINRGQHESLKWYDKCTTRNRNKGLFTADQNVRGDRSTNTRQNANGNRNGYECPEERDYYPYWHPTQWKDIKVLAERADRCEFYEKESFNTKSKWECVEKWRNSQIDRHYSKHNNKDDCLRNGGKWTEFHNYLEILEDVTNKDECNIKGHLWGRPIFGSTEKCLVKLAPPECESSKYSRVNHLGNGKDVEPLSIKWKIPAFPSGKSQRCVLRIRYNITTDDYNSTTADSKLNNVRGVKMSPVTQNPIVNVGDNKKWALAINTAQFGRTFQDRTHIFMLEKKDEIFSSGSTLYTVQVRGKRGNIVQTFPAVEYDFVPNNLTMKSNDLVYFTWTGSNTHNNGNPAGDGQAGDDGEGKGGTDRSNVCGLKSRDENFPLQISDDPSNAEIKGNLCHNIEKVAWSKYKVHRNFDACIQLMTSGYIQCIEEKDCGAESLYRKNKMQDQLDNAPASFPGVILKLKAGIYHYFSTRNNNFSNRAQKASIYVQ